GAIFDALGDSFLRTHFCFPRGNRHLSFANPRQDPVGTVALSLDPRAVAYFPRVYRRPDGLVLSPRFAICRRTSDLGFRLLHDYSGRFGLVADCGGGGVRYRNDRAP